MYMYSSRNITDDMYIVFLCFFYDMGHSQNMSQFKRLLFWKGNSYYFCLNHHFYKSRFLEYDEDALSTKKDIFRRENITFPVNNHMIFI